MVRDLFGIPAIGRIAIGLRYLKLIGRLIGIKMPTLRTERAGATRQFFGQFAVDLKGGSSTMAVSGEMCTGVQKGPR